MIATKVSGELRTVSIAKKTSTIAVAAIPDQDDRADGARLRTEPIAGDTDEQEDDQRARAADGRDRREVDEVGDDEHERSGDQEPGVRAEPRSAPEEWRELPGLGEHRRQPAGCVEGRVHRGGGGEQRGDGHHREARVAERRPRRLGDRGLAVADASSTVSVPKTPSEIRT